VAVLVKTVPFHAPCAKRPATSQAMRGWSAKASSTRPAPRPKARSTT